jgi:hypothetical protein
MISFIPYILALVFLCSYSFTAYDYCQNYEICAVLANKSFIFKIKTKDKSIISGIVIQAKDMDAAKYKLKQRYKDCEILEAHER